MTNATPTVETDPYAAFYAANAAHQSAVFALLSGPDHGERLIDAAMMVIFGRTREDRFGDRDKARSQLIHAYEVNGIAASVRAELIALVASYAAPTPDPEPAPTAKLTASERTFVNAAVNDADFRASRIADWPGDNEWIESHRKVAAEIATRVVLARRPAAPETAPEPDDFDHYVDPAGRLCVVMV